MVTINVQCPIVDCIYYTGDVPEAIAVALLNTHALSHSRAAPHQSTQSSAPRLDRPKVNTGISLEDWNVFQRRWNVFKTGSGIPEDNISAHVFQCASEDLGDSLLKVDSAITNKKIDVLMATMKALAVVPVAVDVLWSDVLDMRQKRDQNFRSFAAMVRGKAETCAFVTQNLCDCGRNNNVDYADKIISDVLISGIYDVEIRREILGIDGVTDRSVNDVISLVEKREMARDANMVSIDSSAISAYKQEGKKVQEHIKFTRPPPGFSKHCPVNREKMIPCPQCGVNFCPFSEGPNEWNTKPHAVCISCFRLRRNPRRQKGQAATNHAVSSASYDQSESIQVISQISVISLPDQSMRGITEPCTIQTQEPAPEPMKKFPPIKLDHHIFSSGEW